MITKEEVRPIISNCRRTEFVLIFMLVVGYWSSVVLVVFGYLSHCLLDPFLAAHAGTTVMVSRHPGRPNDGEAVCKSVGLNYGLWTKPETVSAALTYLTTKNIGEELWIGAIKNQEVVTTTSNSVCNNVPSSQVNTYLRWLSAPTTTLPAFIFSSPNIVNLHKCNNRNILARKDNGKLNFRDEGDQNKKFLCVKEVGELLPVLFNALRRFLIHNKG